MNSSHDISILNRPPQIGAGARSDGGDPLSLPYITKRDPVLAISPPIGEPVCRRRATGGVLVPHDIADAVALRLNCTKAGCVAVA
jgi:hypothetical protein